MLRGAMPWLVVISLAACGDEDGDDGLTGFGPGTTGSATAGPSTAPGSDAGTDGASGSIGSSDALTSSAGGADTTSADGGPATADATTESPPGSSGGPSESTGAPPGGGELGECLGTGAWQSCAQWCSANDRACVDAGCDGATVVYYGDVDACTTMGEGQSDTQACDAAFQMGGGISFARCCCT